MGEWKENRFFTAFLYTESFRNMLLATVLDPRYRRIGTQRPQDGRLRQGPQRPPPRPRQDARIGRRVAPAAGHGRGDRRLLPEGLRSRGLRPCRDQGHPGLQSGA